MADLLQVSDLEKAKLHDTFHSEVVTGKVGGLSTGANIDYATNAVTGQVQKTLPATVNWIDWTPVGNLTTDNCTFTKSTDYAVDDNGTQWAYNGTFPFTSTAPVVPAPPDYYVVHVNAAGAITNANGGSVQDFIDNLDQVYTRTFARVDAMLAFNGLVAGQSVKTLGYYGAGDGGEATYLNRGIGWPEVADGYVNHATTGGQFLELIPVNGYINDKDCGVVGDGVTDDTQPFKALLDYCNLRGFKARILSETILTDQYKNTSVKSLILSPSGETTIKLRAGGQFLIYLANNQGVGQQGQFIVDGPIKFDGNQFGSSVDGGLIQLNSLDYMELNGCDWRGFKNITAVSNGLATTGSGKLVLNNCSAGDCGAQLVYPQNTGGVVINNPDFGESDSHGVAFVNSGKLEISGGRINTINGYGVLTYSTTGYRGNFADISIVGVDLRNNVRPFEIARRYEQASVSGLDMNILLKDIDCRNCTDRAVIGNATTDNADGFTVRDLTIDGVKSSGYIEAYNVKNVRIRSAYTKGGESLIRLRGVIDSLYIDDCEVIGSGNVSNGNTIVYLFANAVISNVEINGVKAKSVYSLMYAEPGAVVNGKVSFGNYQTINNVSGFFMCNSALYSKVGFDRGNRPDRNMAKQTWSADGSLPFYSTDNKKLLYWDGANMLDATGVIVP